MSNTPPAAAVEAQTSEARSQTLTSVVNRLHAALREATLAALESDGFIPHQPQQQPPTPQLVRNGLTDHAIARLPRVLQTDEDRVCVVCHESVAFGRPCVRLPCDHTFHEPCIAAWLQRSNSCPTCRRAAAPRDHELPDLTASFAPSSSSSSFSSEESSTAANNNNTAATAASDTSTTAESPAPPTGRQPPQAPQAGEAGEQHRMRIGISLAHTVLVPPEATVIFRLWTGREYETTWSIYATMAQLFDWLLRLSACNNAPNGLQMRFLASGVMHMYKTSESAAWLHSRTLVRCGLATLYVVQVDPSW